MILLVNLSVCLILNSSHMLTLIFFKYLQLLNSLHAILFQQKMKYVKVYFHEIISFGLPYSLADCGAFIWISDRPNVRNSIL
jgi:hypothetical protein